jgi:hypothetical protein
MGQFNQLGLFVVIAPLIVLATSPWLAPRARKALFASTAATWTAALVAHYLFVDDRHSIPSVLTFFVVILPCVTIPTAAGVAAVCFRRFAAVVPAIGGALVGWILGLIVLDFLPAYPGPWKRAVDVAPSAVYAASLAVLLAGLLGRPSKGTPDGLS